MNEDQKTNLRVQALAFAMASAITLPPGQLLDAAKKYYAFLVNEEPPAEVEEAAETATERAFQ
jgi:hypothetical protein